MRENFTFVYDSRSPFRSGISPEFPRVILFTDDARLVLTFIGDERQPGAELLETMSFDYESATFELHAYLLPAGERKSWRPSAEEARCARCHGADARPIFDSYPLWPGYYGSVQDTFPHDRIGQKEAKNYAAFAAGAAKTGVYKDLIYPAGSPVSPYLDPSLFHDNTVTLQPKLFPYLPNARLGIALTELNRQRIYRKLTAGDGFAANEKQLLAKLLECRPRGPPGPQRDAADRGAAAQRERGAPEAAGRAPRRSEEGPRRHAGAAIRARAGGDRLGGQAGRRRSLRLVDGDGAGLARVLRRHPERNLQRQAATTSRKT